MNLNATLTKREAQITAYLAFGATKKDVANELGISVRTVENITRSIFSKAQVTKVNELAAFYFCKNYNIPLSCSPIKSLLTIVLLFIMLPGELKQTTMTCRSLRNVTVRCIPVRIGRRNESNYYSNHFQYEN